MSANGNSAAPPCQNDPRKLTMQLDLLVASRAEGISPVVRKLMRLLKKTCLLSEHDFAVETALREALANAIVHGHRWDPNKKVRVCCACDSAHGISIVVKDEGEGFDPAKIPDPLSGERIRSEHGRGIFLIKSLMDEVHFENGGREIHMRKGGPAAVQPAPDSTEAHADGMAVRVHPETNAEQFSGR